MKALLRVFWRIAVLKDGPQVLPRSSLLIGIALAFDWSVSALVGALEGSFGVALAEASLAVTLQAIVVAAMLGLTRHLDRFSQTVTALFGTDGLVSLLALPLLGLSLVLPAAAPSLSWLILGFMLWSILIQGHILKHALSIRMSLAMALALAYTLGSIRVFSVLMQSSP